MENEIIGFMITQGAWATLFVVLLFYVLKTNDKREQKYQLMINNLTEQFGIIEEVRKDVCDIKIMLK